MKEGFCVGTVFKTDTSCLYFLCASFFLLAPSCNVNKATCNVYVSDNEWGLYSNKCCDYDIMDSDTIYT